MAQKTKLEHERGQVKKAKRNTELVKTTVASKLSGNFISASGKLPAQDKARVFIGSFNSNDDIISQYNIYYKSPWAKLNAIRHGLVATALNDLIDLTGVTKVDLAHILALTEPTLRKYIKEGKGLNQGLTEHVIQLFELFDKGMDTFGSLEEFKKWLPHHNIGINAKPIELLDTITGINMVMNELIRIDYGVLA